jgi:hypothetical protein
MSSRESFFQPGPTADHTYVDMRDMPRLAEARRFVEELWVEYRPLADGHFCADARNHFLQRFWEMYLAVSLKRKGLLPTKVSDEGPDFYFSQEEKKVWVEAVAPGPGIGPDAVPQPRLDQVSSVPQEQILLRFINALAEKLGTYNEALKKGIIDSSDHYVVAVNYRGIPHALYPSVLPFGVMAYLPFGHPTFTLDKQTRHIVDSYFEHRDQVSKSSGAVVSTDSFLNPEYAGISGVLGSAIYPTDPIEMGCDFWFLHNPLASQPIDKSVFSFCRQYFFQGQTLQTLESNNSLNSR